MDFNGILTRFSVKDLGINYAHKVVNFAHLALLMLLHYLVKFETLKMHVNTSRFLSMAHGAVSRKISSFLRTLRPQMSYVPGFTSRTH